MSYPGLRSFLTYPGLQSCHPYGISVWREEEPGGGAEKVEGIVRREVTELSRAGRLRAPYCGRGARTLWKVSAQ
jgi:hypothetical protein